MEKITIEESKVTPQAPVNPSEASPTNNTERVQGNSDPVPHSTLLIDKAASRSANSTEQPILEGLEGKSNISARISE